MAGKKWSPQQHAKYARTMERRKAERRQSPPSPTFNKAILKAVLDIRKELDALVERLLG